LPSLVSPQLKRLLAYVRPYAFRLVVGVVLVAFVALAEGAVAFMLKVAVDYVLKPSVTVTSLPLFTIPHGRTVFSQRILSVQHPQRLDHFCFSLVTLYVAKALAEYLGTTQIQYVGQAAVTNLRNQVYARIIRQPIGFFQVNPPGRLISGVIEGVERTRIALSEYLADLFQKGFTLLVFVGVLVFLNWKMALAEPSSCLWLSCL